MAEPFHRRRRGGHKGRHKARKKTSSVPLATSPWDLYDPFVVTVKERQSQLAMSGHVWKGELHAATASGLERFEPYLYQTQVWDAFPGAIQELDSDRNTFTWCPGMRVRSRRSPNTEGGLACVLFNTNTSGGVNQPCAVIYKPNDEKFIRINWSELEHVEGDNANELIPNVDRAVAMLIKKKSNKREQDGLLRPLPLHTPVTS